MGLRISFSGVGVSAVGGHRTIDFTTHQQPVIDLLYPYARTFTDVYAKSNPLGMHKVPSLEHIGPPFNGAVGSPIGTSGPAHWGVMTGQIAIDRQGSILDQGNGWYVASYVERWHPEKSSFTSIEMWTEHKPATAAAALGPLAGDIDQIKFGESLAFQDVQGTRFGDFIRNGTVIDASKSSFVIDLHGTRYNETFVLGTGRVDGRGGNDVFIESVGAAVTFHGGAGSDRYVLLSPGKDAGIDRILDFSHQDDRIDLFGLPELALSPGGRGAIDKHYFHIGIEAAGPDDHLIYDPASGRLWIDWDGDGPRKALHFATLANHPADVAAADFFLL